MTTLQDDNRSEKTLRGVLETCADCDTCRFLMDDSCLFFPELYRLYDKQQEAGIPVSQNELQRLSELCTLCGLCPCPDIPAGVIRGKTERVRRQGVPLAIDLLADVQRFGRWCGWMPGLANLALKFPPIAGAAKRLAGIHPRRRLPAIAPHHFFAWARRNGLDRHPHSSPKAAYFAGCTAGYLFPEVARAAVAVMHHNGIAVFVPPQQCCGMPTLVEGDQRTTLDRVRFNLDSLLETVSNGYDLVCSCPTCGFLMKVLLKQRACYSSAYQHSVQAGLDEIKIPSRGSGITGFISLKRSTYQNLLKDDGYFAAIDPLARIALSDSVMDMGEYLGRLLREGRLNTGFGGVEGRMVYFAPCHQREQGIGSPYEAVLSRIPGLIVERVGGAMDCCGMGGSLGLKKTFHEASIRLGSPVIEKIRSAEPQAIITDCLSCRLQFTHLLPYPVLHPLEIISRSYAAVCDCNQPSFSR